LRPVSAKHSRKKFNKTVIGLDLEYEEIIVLLTAKQDIVLKGHRGDT